MENLLINQVNTMSSLQIAELTGKLHKHVLRDIRNMIDQINKSNEPTSGPVDYSDDYHRNDRTQYKYISEKGLDAILNFAFDKEHSQYVIKEENYKDAKGESRLVYLLNKKACFLLASGYDVLLRAKIIDRWEELETKQQSQFKIPQTYSEALRLAADQSEQIDKLNQENQKLAVENNEMHEACDYQQQILQNKGTTLVTQIAQDYGMSAMAFNVMLRNFGVQHKVRNQWILYINYMNKGYVQSSTTPIVHRNGVKDVSLTTEWTQKGRFFLYDFLKKKNVLPLIEKN